MISRKSARIVTDVYLATFTTTERRTSAYAHSMTGIRLTTLSLAVLLHLACTVDKPCTVTMENAPDLRGFRLGMSLDDIQKRFPNFPSFQISANQIGVATVQMSAAYQDNHFGNPDGSNIVSLYYISSFPELSGLKHVELQLLDGRLIR